MSAFFIFSSRIFRSLLILPFLVLLYLIMTPLRVAKRVSPEKSRVNHEPEVLCGGF